METASNILDTEARTVDINKETLRKLVPEKCPECGSGEIEIDTSRDTMLRLKFDGERLLVAKEMPNTRAVAVYCWLCEECGKEGSFGPVLILDESEVEERGVRRHGKGAVVNHPTAKAGGLISSPG